MLDLQDLDKCKTVLTKIKNDVSQHLGIIDKQDLEDVYIMILQEYDAVKEFEKKTKHPRVARESLDVNRLLEDNIQLHRDNERLSKFVNSLLHKLNNTLVAFDGHYKDMRRKIDSIAKYVMEI